VSRLAEAVASGQEVDCSRERKDLRVGGSDSDKRELRLWNGHGVTGPQLAGGHHSGSSQAGGGRKRADDEAGVVQDQSFAISYSMIPW
jgi:hypothetical protein